MIKVTAIKEYLDYFSSMIRVVQRGEYALFETKAKNRIMLLDDTDTYLWINLGGIEELVYELSVLCIKQYIRVGKYRLYRVKNEKNLSDKFHLELFSGLGNWQGYLLPDGLPTKPNQSKKIIFTAELITKITD